MFFLILLFALTHITLGNDMKDGKCVATYQTATTCSSKFEYKGRNYESCTDVDSDHFWCDDKNYHCNQNFNGCTPEIDEDENKWYCSVFPYLSTRASSMIDMGETGFCAEEQARSFPECDPQLPPTVTFRTQAMELGSIDMKKGGNDPDNFGIMKSVLAQARNPNTMIVYIVHGFKNNGEERWQKEIMKGLFNKYGSWGYNVIVGIVSWKWGAMAHFKEDKMNMFNQFTSDFEWCTSPLPILSFYRKAAANTMVIGKHLAALNSWFRSNIEQGYYYPFQTHCIGHSLGAQTCGFFGKSYFEFTGGRKLTSIVGLDPAGPIFEENDEKTQKLYKDDADFVQVIHTDYKFLGHEASMGHIDYYLNGGEVQPADILSSCGYWTSKLSSVVNNYMGNICSHHYAYWFLAKMYNYPTLTCKITGDSGDQWYAIGDLLGKPGNQGMQVSVESKTTKAIKDEKQRPTEYVNTLQC